MARKKSEPAEGIAISVKDVPDRHEAGIAVAVRKNVSAKSESTSTAKSATQKKEG